MRGLAFRVGLLSAGPKFGQGFCCIWHDQQKFDVFAFHQPAREQVYNLAPFFLGENMVVKIRINIKRVWQFFISGLVGLLAFNRVFKTPYGALFIVELVSLILVGVGLSLQLLSTDPNYKNASDRFLVHKLSLQGCVLIVIGVIVHIIGEVCYT